MNLSREEVELIVNALEQLLEIDDDPRDPAEIDLLDKCRRQLEEPKALSKLDYSMFDYTQTTP